MGLNPTYIFHWFFCKYQISKPNSLTQTTSTPPATTTTTTTLPTHRLPPAAKPRGGGVVSYPSKVVFLDRFLEIRGLWKKYVKIRMFWHHTFCRKNSSKSSQNGLKSDILFEFFLEFKIVEFAIPWGLRFSACLRCLILTLFVVAGRSLEVAWSFCCQPELA